MSTIDDADARAMLYDLNIVAAQTIKKQEQEIARLQDQLATAREALQNWNRRHGAGSLEWKCFDCEAIGTKALTAIPTSDRERLLEKARAIVEPVTWASTWNNWQEIIRLRDLADAWLEAYAKLGASNP